MSASAFPHTQEQRVSTKSGVWQEPSSEKEIIDDITEVLAAGNPFLIICQDAQTSKFLVHSNLKLEYVREFLHKVEYSLFHPGNAG